MGKASGPTVGLDIGSHTIKVAEVAPGRGGVTVRALGMAPTPPGALENNVIIDAQLLGQAVKQLLKESGIGAKTSVSSVGGQTALVVRVIEVPKMSDAELAETMRWEVERHVPFAANEVIMDFQAITREDTPPDAQNMEVLLAVAQQDMIDRHVEMLRAAGLVPAAIDVEPLAIARTYINMGPDPLAKRTVAVVNIGAVNTEIAIYKDGLLAFPRTLPLAGEAFTRSIMAHLGVSEEQAEEYKRIHGEIIMDQTAAAPAPAAPADNAFLDFSVPPADAPADGGRWPCDFSEPSDTEPTNLAPPAAAPSPFMVPDADPSPFAVPAADPSPFAVPAAHTDPAPFDTPPPAASPFAVPGDTPFDVPSANPDAPPAFDPAPAASVPAITGQHDPMKLHVFGAMAPVLGELATEILRSLEYYRGRAADGGLINEILLCGGTANIPGLAPYLSAQLGVPARVASPLEHATVASKQHSPEHLESIAPFFAVAVGLGARDKVVVPVLAGAGGKRGKKK
jgi:type IV pilus assembly protein PilM